MASDNPTVNLFQPRTDDHLDPLGKREVPLYNENRLVTHNHEIIVIIEAELIKDLLIMNQTVGKVREKKYCYTRRYHDLASERWSSSSMYKKPYESDNSRKT